MSIDQNAAPALIIACPLIASFVLPLLGQWNRRLVLPVTLAALASSSLGSLASTYIVLTQGPMDYFWGGWEPPWGIAFRIDHLAALMLLLLCTIALTIAVFSHRSILKERPDSYVLFYTVYLLLISGLLGIVTTADLFNLYVFLEITSIASYALVSLGSGSAIVSAFRYVILGTIGAAFYLLSVGYFYSVTGSLNMEDLARILPELYSSSAVRVGFAFLFVGMAIKMALFPMHSWLPGAYATAPSAVSALISSTTSKVAAYILLRISFFVFEPQFFVQLFPVATLLTWMGAVAMVLGSILAISQSNLKRMLAYSSVAQIGYIVLGLGLANEMGLTGSLLHLVNHALAKGGLFLVVGVIFYRTGLREIQQLRNLARRMPWTAATFTLAAGSIIGIPPFGGFFSKLYLILGAINSGQWGLIGAVLLSSLLALFYFSNVIRYLYLSPTSSEDDSHEERLDEKVPLFRHDNVPLSMLVPMILLITGTVLLGLFNGSIVSSFIEPIVPESILQ